MTRLTSRPMSEEDRDERSMLIGGSFKTTPVSRPVEIPRHELMTHCRRVAEEAFGCSGDCNQDRACHCMSEMACYAPEDQSMPRLPNDPFMVRLVLGGMVLFWIAVIAFVVW